jgi:hypothetical protein
MSENKTQTQVETFLLEERKVYYDSRLAPGYLQNGTGPKLRWLKFLY